MSWSYDQPTAPGWYMANYGDVVTDANLMFVYLIEKDGELIDVSNPSEITAIKEFNKSIKYKAVDVSALNREGNE